MFSFICHICTFPKVSPSTPACLLPNLTKFCLKSKEVRPKTGYSLKNLSSVQFSHSVVHEFLSSVLAGGFLTTSATWEALRSVVVSCKIQITYCVLWTLRYSDLSLTCAFVVSSSPLVSFLSLQHTMVFAR